MRERLASVAVVVTSLGAGGAEKQAVLLANHLAESRRVTVVVMYDDLFRLGELAQSIEVVRLKLQRKLAPVSTARAFRAIRKEFRRLRPDLTLTFNYPAFAMVTVLQFSGLKMKHVASERSSRLGGGARKFARRFGYRRCELVVVNTPATEREIRQSGLDRSAPITVVPNAVHPPPPEAVREPRESPFQWICVARMEPAKDHFTLITAVELLAAEGREFRVVLVGDGSLRAEVDSRICTSGLSGYFRVLGNRNDVPALLAEADAFVLTSAWEGLPNVLLEAGAAGLPIVSTDVGGVRDAIPLEGIPYLAASRDTHSIAERMAKVMDLDAPSRQRLGQLTRNHALSQCGEAKVFALWDNAISRALAPPAAQGESV